MENNMVWVALYVTVAIIIAIGFIGIHFENKMHNQKDKKN